MTFLFTSCVDMLQAVSQAKLIADPCHTCTVVNCTANSESLQTITNDAQLHCDTKVVSYTNMQRLRVENLLLKEKCVKNRNQIHCTLSIGLGNVTGRPTP